MITLLIGVALGGLVVAMLLAPVEALGWWAGWYGEGLAQPEQGDASAYVEAGSSHKATHYVVFLDGIAKIGPQNYDDVQALLDRLSERLPDAVVLGDVMPYSVTNTGLLEGRPLSHFWRYAFQLKREGKRPLIAFTINLRNVFQVLVAADARYGPIYSQGEAQSIATSLLHHGYQPGSGTPVTLIGYSGGGQIALGVTRFLKRALNAPVTVISLGGVMSSDAGLGDAEHLYHLVGSRDPVPTLGRLFPGRWALLVNSHWNRLVRQGKFTLIKMGPMRHNGAGSYLDDKPKLESGESFLEHTTTTLAHLLNGATKRPADKRGKRDPERISKRFFLVVFVGLLLAALWFFRNTLLLAFLAVVLAVGISIPAGWLVKRRCSSPSPSRSAWSC